MTMTANGLAKLIEECGELVQVAGKRLAYYHTDEHPDGGEPLPKRLEMEIADVMAACKFVIATHRLNRNSIDSRIAKKLSLFNEWHREELNNTEAVDR
jgi:NTP pyrophosphatase (non-canonical NTP hydrolase)